MDFLERDLEDIIHESSQTEDGRAALVERGLDINAPLSRQVKIGSYGIIDLFNMEYDVSDYVLQVNIFELKKGDLTLDDIGQLCRYVTGVKRFINENPVALECEYISVNGYLIGKSFKGSDKCYIYNQTQFHINVLTYDFDLKHGLKFEYEPKVWRRTEESFTSKTYDSVYGSLYRYNSIKDNELKLLPLNGEKIEE